MAVGVGTAPVGAAARQVAGLSVPVVVGVRQWRCFRGGIRPLLCFAIWGASDTCSKLGSSALSWSVIISASTRCDGVPVGSMVVWGLARPKRGSSPLGPVLGVCCADHTRNTCCDRGRMCPTISFQAILRVLSYCASYSGAAGRHMAGLCPTDSARGASRASLVELRRGYGALFVVVALLLVLATGARDRAGGTGCAGCLRCWM